ncbi:hypothetical protein GWK08_13885 [Leptobacterium flavescens]|uniref:Uncharacterized protein n=1 Tax=Leptobacterium flavescens TaxID=472055 RepID=A0A6P0UPZ1_9FLAO|nr:hypothetical protein [Leptobacterium flavescens]NER14540.1 hypothetical protein [Leptobacterium flavescens]
MKKLIFLMVILVSFSFGTPEDPEVYICASKNSKRYHFRKDCRGLSRCKAKIVKMPLSKAKKIGRTLCGYED